ncbi:MAG: hypothetical protein AB1599_06365 [Planctomycetota bacterium]
MKSQIVSKCFKWLSWGLGALLLGVLILLSVYYTQSHFIEYVPTSQDMKDRFPEFIISNSRVDGIYCNLDNPCCIFKYSMPSRIPTNDIITTIIDKASEQNWNHTEITRDIIRFSRQKQQDKCGEEVTVVVTSQDSKVYVGWMVLGYQSEWHRWFRSRMESYRNSVDIPNSDK